MVLKRFSAALRRQNAAEGGNCFIDQSKKINKKKEFLEKGRKKYAVLKALKVFISVEKFSIL